jgi:hypothetical protein
MKLLMIFLMMGHNQNNVQGLYAHDPVFFSRNNTLPLPQDLRNR